MVSGLEHSGYVYRSRIIGIGGCTRPGDPIAPGEPAGGYLFFPAAAPLRTVGRCASGPKARPPRTGGLFFIPGGLSPETACGSACNFAVCIHDLFRLVYRIHQFAESPCLSVTCPML